MGFSDCFILGYVNIGEYDRRILLLSSQYGKMRAVCKSILKPKAKLAGHLDFPNLSWVEIVPSQKGWQITQALEKNSYPKLRHNPAALKAALASARTLDIFLPVLNVKGEILEVEPEIAKQNALVFTLWAEFLQVLEKGAVNPASDFEFWQSQLNLKLLKIWGFLPDAFSCANCSRELSDAAHFFDSQFYCPTCAKKLQLKSQVFSGAALQALEKIIAGKWFKSIPADRELKTLGAFLLEQTQGFML